jgi:hypothetical protein
MPEALSGKYDFFSLQQTLLTHSRYGASTVDVLASAMSLVHHAAELVNGPASIMAVAICPARLHAIDYHAMGGVRSFLFVVTSVLASVVRTVLPSFAKNAI